jgi:hypothetical protein
MIFKFNFGINWAFKIYIYGIELEYHLCHEFFQEDIYACEKFCLFKDKSFKIFLMCKK